jgi:hypothetical protein
MKDIIPSEEKYNKTIIHKDNKNKPKIINNNSYNEICKKNEKHILNLLSNLYSTKI